jgi:pyridoxamine 5'-phosphate oxidase
MKKDLRSVRENYNKGVLRRSSMLNNPIEQFNMWLEEYQSLQQSDFNAMTLSTLGKDGFPHSRVVLLKEVDSGDFVFYTNYESDKGKEINQQPRVALNFFWPEMERQIRIEGIARQVDEQVSEEYFRMRPRESQIGAWASPQSREVDGEEDLNQRFKECVERFKDTAVIPRPPHWGGYAVKPVMIEFWQGRPSRLHDRFRYVLQDGGVDNWSMHRLAP